MSKKRIFADGMSTISLSGGLIRMNFFNIEAEGQDNKPDVNTELIMPPQNFLQAFTAMEDLIKKMMNDGIISRKGAAQNGAADGKSEASANPSSPNFD